MTQSPYPNPQAAVPTPPPAAASYPPPPPNSPYAAYPTVGYGPGQQGAPMVVRTNTLSVITLITAIIGFVGLPVILGHISLNTIKRTGERGYAFAVIGLVLGYLELAVLIGVFWLAFLSSMQ